MIFWKCNNSANTDLEKMIDASNKSGNNIQFTDKVYSKMRYGKSDENECLNKLFPNFS